MTGDDDTTSTRTNLGSCERKGPSPDGADAACFLEVELVHRIMKVETEITRKRENESEASADHRMAVTIVVCDIMLSSRMLGAREPSCHRESLAATVLHDRQDRVLARSCAHVRHEESELIEDGWRHC